MFIKYITSLINFLSFVKLKIENLNKEYLYHCNTPKLNLIVTEEQVENLNTLVNNPPEQKEDLKNIQYIIDLDKTQENKDISSLVSDKELRRFCIEKAQEFRIKNKLTGVLGDPFTHLICVMDNLLKVSQYIERDVPEIVEDSKIDYNDVPEGDIDLKFHDIPESIRDLKVAIGAFDRIIAKKLEKIIRTKYWPVNSDEVNLDISNILSYFNSIKLPPDNELQDWINNSLNNTGQMVTTLKQTIPIDTSVGEFLHVLVDTSLVANQITIYKKE